MKTRLATTVVTLISAAALAAACGSKSKGAKSASEKLTKTDNMWSLAPADAVAGVVAADGSGRTFHAALLEFDALLGARPELNQQYSEWRREVSSAPVNILDVASFAEAGIDLDQGFAVFVNAADEFAAVLPVKDRAAFLKNLPQQPQEAGGIDDFGIAKCRTVGRRYACAQTDALLAQIGSGGATPIIKEIKALPVAVRGDVEVYASSRYPRLSQLPNNPLMSQIGHVVVAARMGGGKLDVSAHVSGRPADQVLAASKVSTKLLALVQSAKPSGFAHFKVPVDQFGTPPGGLPGLPSFADLIGAVDGEVATYARSGANFRYGVTVGLRNAAPIRELTKAACTMLPGFVQGVTANPTSTGCTGLVDVAVLARNMGERMPLSPMVSFAVEISDNAVTIEFGKNGEQVGADAPPMTATGAAYMKGDFDVRLYGELGSAVPVYEAVSKLRVRNQERDMLKAVTWFAAHIAEVGFGVSMREDGVRASMSVAMFHADPPAALGAYGDAISKALAGDFNGATLAMAEISTKYPGTYAGRASKVGAGGPSAAAMVLGWFMLAM